MNNSLHIGVLGPIDVAIAGHSVRLAGPKQRALLAALALEQGKAVSVDRLVDTLWSAAPPATARAKVHTHISALRRALRQGGEEWILTQPPGYLLRTAGVQSDLADFDYLVAQAQAASLSGDKPAAAGLYARALGLWRGTALCGIDSPLLAAVAASLNERRVLAIEAGAEANLDAGRCDAAVTDLSAALALFPLRERLRGLMMLALYRLGCRSDALRLYRDGYRLMAQELGLEPGPPLRELHQRILTGDPAL